jgi:hypothetical protein
MPRERRKKAFCIKNKKECIKKTGQFERKTNKKRIPPLNAFTYLSLNRKEIHIQVKDEGEERNTREK